MEESRIVGHDASAQTVAEKIIRDAETRQARSPEDQKNPGQETTSSYLGMTRREAPRIGAEPSAAIDASTRLQAAPAEDIVRNVETQRGRSADDDGEAVHETTSSYLGMTRKETPLAAAEPPVHPAKSRGVDVPAGDDPAPFSSALGIPTLVKEDVSAAPKGDDPAPFSEALHIPTLINESKPGSNR